MKKLHIATLAAILICGSALATKPQPGQMKFALGVHTGIDIGGAVPWPPGEIMGGGNKMSAVPHLTPAVGLSYTMFYNKHWSTTVEGTYKTVALDAKAYVMEQRFRDLDNPGKQIAFRGKAKMKMNFPMIEVPVYMRYTFNNDNNRIFFGAYYAYVLGGEFEASPYTGALFKVLDNGKLDDVPTPVTEDNPYTQIFNNDMDNWDVGMILGYERRIINRVLLSGRFSMGFKDIFKPDSKQLAYNMLHMRGTIVLSYMFMRK